MPTQTERRAATRTRLITVAREHFAREGYEGAHTNEILAHAGLSRGALYHHFQSKQDLFEAVFVAVSNESIERAAKYGLRSDSPLENLIRACLAWLRAVKQPEVAAIVLDQGPQVLGWKRARELESKSSLGLVKESLERADQANELQVSSIELTARLINALLAEVALATLYGEPKISVAKQEASIRQFIEGLR